MSLQKQVDNLIHYLKQYGGNITLSELIAKIEQKIKEAAPDLDDYKDKYLNKYYKYQNDCDIYFIHIKSLYIDERNYELTVVYDELLISNYEQISFTSGKEEVHRWMFAIPYKEILQDEWIKEVCYYFKRVPGIEELCCPESEN